MMKKSLFVIALLLVSVYTVLAQEYVKETVYLKNGSIIKGIVVEQIPNETIKIQTADGSLFVYKMSEVEKITKEIIDYGTKKSSPFQETSSPARFVNDDMAGYRGFVDLGYTFGMGDYSNLGRLEVSTSHGYQFNPYFFLGGGVGYQYSEKIELSVIPFFADFRANFMRGKVVPFGGIKAGYAIGTTSEETEGLGFYMNPSVGVKFVLQDNFAINIHMGYTLQLIDYSYYYDYGYGYDDYYYSGTENWGGFSLKVGFEF